MDYLVKIRSVQTPLNGQFSIGANILQYSPRIAKANTAEKKHNLQLFTQSCWTM